MNLSCDFLNSRNITMHNTFFCIYDIHETLSLSIQFIILYDKLITNVNTANFGEHRCKDLWQYWLVLSKGPYYHYETSLENPY